jgi:GMP synthase-like glutamine amidotransferase
MASCLVVQHVEPEGPYAIAEALEEAGVAVDVRRVFASAALPTDLSDVDGVVIMGGPMSASRDEGFPTRRAELALLVDALRLGRPTLGVCLGAQLLALAGGGHVYPGADGPEIGWAAVEFTAESGQDPLLADLPRQLTVLHWHGDTFDPPPGTAVPPRDRRAGGRRLPRCLRDRCRAGGDDPGIDRRRQRRRPSLPGTAPDPGHGPVRRACLRPRPGAPGRPDVTPPGVFRPG